MDQIVMPVRWIRQEQPWGCVLASAAMLLGLSYEEAVPLFGADEGHFESRGIGIFVLECILAERGYAIAKRYKTLHPGNRKREVWPSDPFGDVHLCDVICKPRAPGAHAVVMLADGSVLDPAFEEPRRLSDYHAVNFVAAVVPLTRT